VATHTHTDENVALARQLFDWFRRGDVDSLRSALAPDVEARPRTGGAPALSGREEVVQWWGEVTRLGADLEVRPLQFEGHGDHVIVRGYLRQRDGRAIAESQVYWFYEIRDGMVARMELHPSRASALAAR
jgi:ketosteroid isomerase-like protein